MKAVIEIMTQRIIADGEPDEIATIYGQVMNAISILNPILQKRFRDTGEPARPSAATAQPDRSTEVDQLLDWIADHIIREPGDKGNGKEEE